MVRNHEPVAIEFLIHVGDDDVDLDHSTVLQVYWSALLAHLPREIAIDMNMLV